jgi:hypothetical protein
MEVGGMILTCRGVAKGNTIVLDEQTQLPEGARVAVSVQIEEPRRSRADQDTEDPFEVLLRRRAAYGGRCIGIDEIIEEEKQDREERFDHWLFPRG